MTRSPRREPYQTDPAALAPPTGSRAARSLRTRRSRGLAQAGLALSALLSLLAGACSTEAAYPAPTHPDAPLPSPIPMTLSAEEASLFVGRPEVAFIDTRPSAAYRKGHAPGAVHVEWTEFRDQQAGLLDGKLDADLRRLARLFSERGVGRQSWAILFGDPANLWGEEGRIAWTLAYLGAERISIVDGGYPAWEAAGLPTQRGEVKREAAPFEVEVQDRLLARKGDVEEFSARRDEWRTVLVDVREPEEYRGAPGAPLYGALRGGHIPGAVNLPWRSLLDKDGKLLPRDALGELLLSKGIRPDARIITYCTGGVRSAHTWFILRGLGYPSVKNYAASWWEWSLDRKLPAESGGQRPLPDAPPWPPEDEDQRGSTPSNTP